MAEFEGAISATLLWEGGYTNNPSDSGGETYMGISRNNWPSWSGWDIIDRMRPSPTFPNCLHANVDLQLSVIAFYKQNFWFYDGVTDQPIADKIFDLGVNVGLVHAHKIVQTAVNVTADGLWGPATEAAVNFYPPQSGSLLTKIRIAAADYHQAIVHSHPEDAEFLAGWLRRDAS